MTTSETLQGRIIDGYMLTESLSKNRFSEVFSAVHTVDERKAVYKIALQEPSEQFTNTANTEALLLVTGGVANVFPNTNDLLEYQYNTLLDYSGSSELVKAESFNRLDGSSLIRMEFIAGVTLQKALETSLTLTERRRLINNILPAARNFLAQGRRHGDLTPKNILLDGNAVRFIDPGYFGVIETDYGREQTMITTPAYYPHLRCDDVLALGIICWQIMLTKNPFIPTNSPGQAGKHSFSQSVAKMVKGPQRVGIHYLAPLLQLDLPHEIDQQLGEGDEQLLLRGLRLQLGEDGIIHGDEGFASAEEMFQAWAS